MRAFRASWLAATVFLATAITCLGQAGGPATAPPRSLPGAPANPDPTPAPESNTAPSAPSGIAVSQLGSYEGPSTGLLDDTNGGLGPNIWSGTTRADAIGLIEQMPAATPVVSMHDLARRVLETRAVVPSGDTDRSFQAVRLRKMLEAGFVEDAGIMAGNMQVPDAPDFARAQADAILLAGHANDACSPLTQTRLTSGEPFWIELRAYCYAKAGDSAALELTKAVMDTQGIDDEAFNVLLDGIQSGQKVGPGDIEQPTALHAFLIGQVGVPLPPALAAKLGVAGSMLVLRDPASTVGNKLAAADVAVKAGALSRDALEKLADAAKFSDDRLKNADTVAATLPFVAGQALLRQAAVQATDNDRKAHLVAAALALGERQHNRPAAAELQASVAVTVAPDPAIKDLANAFRVALLLAREPEAARRWRTVLQARADKISSEALLAEVNLLAPATDPKQQQDVQDALDDLADQIGAKQPSGGEEGRETAALIVMVYDALGETMSEDAKAELADSKDRSWPGRAFTPAELGRIQEAASNSGRKAEAIAALLSAIGAGGPADLSPDTIAASVRALVNLGEPKAARDFAIDALALYRPAPPLPPPADPAPTQ